MALRKHGLVGPDMNLMSEVFADKGLFGHLGGSPDSDAGRLDSPGAAKSSCGFAGDPFARPRLPSSLSYLGLFG